MARHKSAKTIASEIEKSFKKHKGMIEKAMESIEPGTRSHLDHISALSDLERKYRDERAKRGLGAMNLGVAAAPAFYFRATIDNGSICTEQVTAERQEWEQRLNAEYSSDVEPAPLDPEKEAERRRDQEMGQRYTEELGGGTPAVIPVQLTRNMKKVRR